MISIKMQVWGILNYKNEIFPTCTSYTRRQAIRHFLDPKRGGYDGTWRQNKRRGFRCVRMTLEAEL